MVLIHDETGLVPLRSVLVQTNVVSFTSVTTVTQTWFSSKAIRECRYEFPLNPKTTVTSFTLKCPGMELEAKVKEKTKGEEIFQKAKTSGKTAAILTEFQTRKDVYCVRISNLPKNVEIETKICYNVELDFYVADKCELVFPLSLAPRYPGLSGPMKEDEKEESFSLFSWDKESQPISPSLTAYSLELRIVFRGVKNVYCETHNQIVLQKEKSDKKENDLIWKAQLKVTKCSGWEKDLIFLVTCSAFTSPTLFLEERKTLKPSVAGLLCFGPGVLLANTAKKATTSLKEATKEILFMVDCSGSMCGSAIQNVRNALQVLVASLPSTRCYFNVLRWGDTTQWLFETSVLVTDDSVELAREKITEEVQADLGGTEMLKALEVAFANLSQEADEHELIFLTDGEVEGETDRFNSFVKENLTKTKPKTNGRLWTIGFGDRVNRKFLEQAAAIGGGVARFVTSPVVAPEKCSSSSLSSIVHHTAQRRTESQKEMKEVLIELLDLISVPLLQKMEMKLGVSIPVEPVPYIPIGTKHKARATSLAMQRSCIFHFQLHGYNKKTLQSLFAQQEHKKKIRDFVVLQLTDSKGETKSVSVPFQTCLWISLEQAPDFLHKLYAKAQIRDLENEQSKMHLGGVFYSQQEKEQELVGWSLKEGILSSKTCAVVVCKTKKWISDEEEEELTEEYSIDVTKESKKEKEESIFKLKYTNPVPLEDFSSSGFASGFSSGGFGFGDKVESSEFDSSSGRFGGFGGFGGSTSSNTTTFGCSSGSFSSDTFGSSVALGTFENRGGSLFGCSSSESFGFFEKEKEKEREKEKETLSWGGGSEIGEGDGGLFFSGDGDASLDFGSFAFGSLDFGLSGIKESGWKEEARTLEIMEIMDETKSNFEELISTLITKQNRNGSFSVPGKAIEELEEKGKLKIESTKRILFEQKHGSLLVNSLWGQLLIYLFLSKHGNKKELRLILEKLASFLRLNGIELCDFCS